MNGANRRTRRQLVPRRSRDVKCDDDRHERDESQNTAPCPRALQP
jgi:hypothetical protein